MTLQNTEEVPTELNNNSKTGGKDNMLVPRNEESTATAVTTAPLPATILWGPCDTTVLRGARVVLETSYAGNPEPSIQWLRAVSRTRMKYDRRNEIQIKRIFSDRCCFLCQGKVLVETDERLRITNADGISSLTIDSITADDCGKYIVRVDNGLGNDYHFASVAVEGTPAPPNAGGFHYFYDNILIIIISYIFPSPRLLINNVRVQQFVRRKIEKEEKTPSCRARKQQLLYYIDTTTYMYSWYTHNGPNHSNGIYD